MILVWMVFQIKKPLAINNEILIILCSLKARKKE
jgi:hypothetical protein